MTTYLLPYTAGTVSTNGTAVVTGHLTAWLDAAQPGDQFRIGSDARIIQTVDSNTQITCIEAWPTTASGQTYAIDRWSQGHSAPGTLALRTSQLLESLGTSYAMQSPTSVEIAAGLKTFDVVTGVPLLPGAVLIASSRANLANTMWGVVTDYTGTAITIDVAVTAGAGTFDDWNINIAGNVGPQGPDGRSLLNGTAAPTTEGTDGDFYIRTSNWTIYGPKTGGAWGSGTSLVGPSGGAFNTTTVPSPTSGEHKPFLYDRATKLFPALIGPDGEISWLGSMMGIPNRHMKLWKAGNNSTTPAMWNFGNSVTGTQGAHIMVATDGIRGQVPKISYTTAASNNAAAGTRHAISELYRGTAAGEGGFLYAARIGPRANFDDANSGTRAYCGLYGNNLVISGGTEPSDLMRTVALGKDGADTTWQIIHNDGSGVCTKVDLGANFPANTNYEDVYDLWLYCTPNSSTIEYRVDRRSATTMAITHTATGTLSTNLPTNNQRLSPQVWCCTGSPNPLAVAIDVYWQYVEVEY